MIYDKKLKNAIKNGNVWAWCDEHAHNLSKADLITIIKEYAYAISEEVDEIDQKKCQESLLENLFNGNFDDEEDVESEVL